MVSFCDIPLSQIKEHIENYGNYAIGLSKEWGIDNGISPVLYVHKNSMLVNVHQDLTNFQLFKGFGKEKNFGEAMEILRKLVEIEYIIKPYKGRKWNKNNFDNKEIEFYKEREWRYTPDIIRLEDNAFGLHHLVEEKKILSAVNDLNYRMRYFKRPVILDKVETFKLRFTPKDIKYIILANENEIIPFCNWIQRLKKENYEAEELEKLKTRIITIEQVLSDF